MNENEEEYSLKRYFVPFTSVKAICFIIIIGFIVYFNTFFNGFVWDDKTYILNYVGVHSIDLLNAFKQNLFNIAGQYRPIPVIYFSILYSLFNTLPFFYHVIQVSIHILNAILLFLLVKHFLSKKLGFFLALIFLIHPMQVESVSYIGASGSVLFTFFGITALLLCVSGKSSLKKSLFVFSLILLSILTKETGILFFVVTLLYIFMYKKKELVLHTIYSLLTLLIYCFIRFYIGGIFFETRELATIARLSLLERLTTIPAVVFYYLKTFFFPLKLSIGQDWVVSQINFNNFYLPLFIDSLIVLFFSLVGLYLFRMKQKAFKAFIFFSLWFWAGLLMHSQIFPLDLTVADRWFYFPIIGLLGSIGVFFQSIILRPKSLYKMGAFLAITIVVLLSVRTIQRNSNWVNAITLYTHDIQILDTWDLENNLGAEYNRENNQQEALKHYLRSAEIFPFENNIHSVGVIYANLGNTQKAKEYYYKALSTTHYSLTHNHNIKSYLSLGIILLLRDESHEAQKIIKEGLLDYPDSADLWELLSISQYWLHDNSAVPSAMKAKNLRPDKFSNYIYEKIINKQPLKMYPAKNSFKIL